jgi:hypothetical protein
MIKYSVLLGLVIWLCSSCTDNPIGNHPPEISFAGMSKDKLNQGSLGLNDTILVSLNFVDVDGDLSGAANNVVVIDNRLNETHYINTIPDLPPTKNGNVGIMTINIPTVCCIFSDGTPACDSPPNTPTNEITFDIFLVDQLGNESNRVTTPSITLFCN